LCFLKLLKHWNGLDSFPRVCFFTCHLSYLFNHLTVDLLHFFQFTLKLLDILILRNNRDFLINRFLEFQYFLTESKVICQSTILRTSLCCPPLFQPFNVQIQWTNLVIERFNLTCLARYLLLESIFLLITILDNLCFLVVWPFDCTEFFRFDDGEFVSASDFLEFTGVLELFNFL